jgi:hypothetical protein
MLRIKFQETTEYGQCDRGRFTTTAAQITEEGVSISPVFRGNGVRYLHEECAGFRSDF